MATREAAIAVALAEPYGANVYVIDGDHVARHLMIAGGDKLGLDIALAGDGASFGAAWTDRPDGLRYGRVDLDASAPFVPRPLGISGSGTVALVQLGAQLVVATEAGASSDGGTALAVLPVGGPRDAP